MADPIRRFRKWFNEAAKAGIELPDACALATADECNEDLACYIGKLGDDDTGAGR